MVSLPKSVCGFSKRFIESKTLFHLPPNPKKSLQSDVNFKIALILRHNNCVILTSLAIIANTSKLHQLTSKRRAEIESSTHPATSCIETWRPYSFINFYSTFKQKLRELKEIRKIQNEAES